MFRSLRSLMLIACVFSFFFICANFNQLEAAHGRWGAYNHNNERGAWGGNGGWWGDSRGDWYGDDYNPPNQYNGAGYGHPDNGYYYNNNYPYGGQYYDNSGIGAGESVDGAGLYFNAR